MCRASVFTLAALLLAGCANTVRLAPPAVARAFDGLPDPAQLSSAFAPQRLPRGTPLTLVVSKNTERLLTLIDSCRRLTLKEAPRPSSFLLPLTGITPPEVNARLDIGQVYVAKIAHALDARFGKVGFAASVDEARHSAQDGTIALLDATGGRTRCAESPGGDIGLVLDRIDTHVLFLSPSLQRLCEVRSDARWSEAEWRGAVPLFASSLERHRDYLDWLGESFEQRLGQCVE